MPLQLITQQLFETTQGKSIKGQVSDPENIEGLISMLKTSFPESLTIYDITHDNLRKPGEKIQVNDHINRTGSNPLIGRQARLGVDFIDLSHIYQTRDNGVITNCVGGDYPRFGVPNPSPFLCNIAIIARALGVKTITAFLYNVV